jgi:hydroxypyruvate isomerase
LGEGNVNFPALPQWLADKNYDGYVAEVQDHH